MKIKKPHIAAGACFLPCGISYPAMKKILTIAAILLTAAVLHAQCIVPIAIKKAIPTDYSISHVICSDDESSAKGVAVVSIPQDNACYGADSAYITISYEYFSRGNYPHPDDSAKKNMAFEKGVNDNYLLTVKNIPEGLLNTTDKTYTGCSTLNKETGQNLISWHYYITYECTGAEKTGTKDAGSGVQGKFRYTDIYMIATTPGHTRGMDITIIFHGTFNHPVAMHHVNQLAGAFAGLDYGKVVNSGQ